MKESVVIHAEILFTYEEMNESFIHATFSHIKSYRSNEIAGQLVTYNCYLTIAALHCMSEKLMSKSNYLLWKSEC